MQPMTSLTSSKSFYPILWSLYGSHPWLCCPPYHVALNYTTNNLPGMYKTLSWSVLPASRSLKSSPFINFTLPYIYFLVHCQVDVSCLLYLFKLCFARVRQVDIWWNRLFLISCHQALRCMHRVLLTQFFQRHWSRWLDRSLQEHHSNTALVQKVDDIRPISAPRIASIIVIFFQCDMLSRFVVPSWFWAAKCVGCEAPTTVPRKAETHHPR